MKSEIKIDYIDRGTGKGIEPVIRIELRNSQDPRDTLIHVLFESLQSESFLQLQYGNHKPVLSGGEPDIEKQILLFKPEPAQVNIHDNSTGFRKFLDEKGIKWKANEHYTAITDVNIDLFQLGQDLEKYKAVNS
jgi:hypothetical protein